MSASSADRGQTVTIKGEGWGDECYDTGPPPPGQGALGTPVTGIEIVLTQGSTETVVARGDADATYRFTVDITVPDSLQPGTATLSARSSQVPAFALPQPLTVSAQPSSTTDQTVATFGPNATATSTDAVPTLVGEPAEQSSGRVNSWAPPSTDGHRDRAPPRRIVIRRRRSVALTLPTTRTGSDRCTTLRMLPVRTQFRGSAGRTQGSWRRYQSRQTALKARS